MPSARCAWTALAVLIVALSLTAGCVVTTPEGLTSNDGRPQAVDPPEIRGAEPAGPAGSVDRIASASLADLRSYWRASFEPAFGIPWQDLSGGFYSVDTTSPDVPPPPCLARAVDLAGNAFYCSAADAIAWDGVTLLPALRERYGDAGIAVVLAHEFGHAVHTRLGIEPGRTPGRFPTVLAEAMADCYAGAFFRWVADGHAPSLRLDQQELDTALSALVTFRDPVGLSVADAEAHGNAFDRVSAFQDGYQRGPIFCAQFTMQNRQFTQQRFRTLDDQIRGGNLPFEQLLVAITQDLDTYFGDLVTLRGAQWQDPRVLVHRRVPNCVPYQGPVAFCRITTTIELDVSDQLPALHAELGDYATGTLLTSRYSLAALDALGQPTQGRTAQRAALCLAGSYTGTLLTRHRGFGLSPGDLDEAVQVLLSYDYAARDLGGQATLSGFERVSQFRAGTLGGVAACGV